LVSYHIRELRGVRGVEETRAGAEAGIGLDDAAQFVLEIGHAPIILCPCSAF